MLFINQWIVTESEQESGISNHFWHFKIDFHFSYLETFPHVGLHSEGILGFAENFQKLIVRQEEEARKEQSFLLQIVV